MLGVSAAAQTSSAAWTLQDCIDHALQNNIQLKKQQAATQTAQVSVSEAKAAYLPSLSASVTQGVTWRPNQESMGNFVNGGITSSSGSKATESGSYGISASWNVWNGGRRALTLKSSQKGAEIAAMQEQTVANSLQEQIAGYYVQLLYMQEAERVNTELYRQDSIVCERGREMLRQGQISKADLAQLEAQVSGARYDIVNVRTQIANARKALEQLLELQPGTAVSIAAVPVADAQVLAAIPSREDAYAAALTSRPEIRGGELSIEQSEIQTSIARRGQLPSISLSAGVGDSHMTGGQNDFWKQMKTNFNINGGLTVSVPIFDNRQTKSAVERAKINEETARLELADTKKQLYNSVTSYWLDATNAQEKFVAGQANVSSVQQSYDMIQEQFRMGLKNIQELLTSRASLLSARQSLLQDKYTAVLNRTLLEFYTGKRIEL